MLRQPVIALDPTLKIVAAYDHSLLAAVRQDDLIFDIIALQVNRFYPLFHGMHRGIGAQPTPDKKDLPAHLRQTGEWRIWTTWGGGANVLAQQIFRQRPCARHGMGRVDRANCARTPAKILGQRAHTGWSSGYVENRRSGSNRGITQRRH